MIWKQSGRERREFYVWRQNLLATKALVCQPGDLWSSSSTITDLLLWDFGQNYLLMLCFSRYSNFWSLHSEFSRPFSDILRLHLFPPVLGTDKGSHASPITQKHGIQPAGRTAGSHLAQSRANLASSRLLRPYPVFRPSPTRHSTIPLNNQFHWLAPLTTKDLTGKIL